jgi:LacI family transcriptional regulator
MILPSISEKIFKSYRTYYSGNVDVFYSFYYKGISSVLHKEGYHFFVVLRRIFGNGGRKYHYLHQLACRRNSYFSYKTNERSFSPEQNKEIEVPVVMFDKTISQNSFEQIIFDNKLNVETAAEKLAKISVKKFLPFWG